jgi:murein DD-endopeptidase MepM/ murein hydrolase activator NlpD
MGGHTGAQKFAIDFGVPRGTEVVAAMHGLVVDIVSNQPNMAIGTRGAADADNLVRIRHDDLTYGVYGHLQPNGAKVAIGDKVQIGTLLALSGNSGDTNGDHLHFAVEKTTDTGYETVDCDFVDGAAQAYVPSFKDIFEVAGGKVTGQLIIGTGDPQGNVVGDVGDIFERTDGAVGTLYYVKDAGAGTKTGWAARAVFP